MAKTNPIHRAAVGALNAAPRPVVRHFAREYVAGPHLSDALRVARELQRAGRLVTYDVLGEGYDTPAKARALADEYVDILRADDGRVGGPSLSVMMTGLGLLID